MQDLCFIFLIILEICATIFAVYKLTALEAKIDEFHEQFLILAKEVLVINEKVQETIKKINKVLKFITNKKLFKIITVLKTIFNIIQLILFIRSFDFSKNKKILNYKNIKKLFLTEFVRRIVRKFLLSTADLI